MRSFSTIPNVLSIFMVATAALLLFTSNASARDTLHTYPVDNVINNDRLEGVQFFFGDSPHPPVDKEYGEFTSNRKTNAFNKEDREACDWVLLTALLALKDRALQMGGNAVINVRSYYKKNDFRGNNEYQCGAGNIMAGVTMKGTVVKLK